MSRIQQTYNNLCNTNSDINQHLPVLLECAKQCKTIAEFGVRDAVSVYAFAAAKPEKLICVDINRSHGANIFLSMCSEENVPVQFDIADSRTYNLEPVDLLFIDTLHTYGQLKTELAIHANKVNKFIILHDTLSYGFVDETHVYSSVFQNEKTDPNERGLIPAIMNFLQSNLAWRHYCTYPYNNGLTILTRR